MGAATEIVPTDAGPVRGTVTEEYRLFRGIPYAASTASERRWRPPQPAAPWAEPRPVMVWIHGDGAIGGGGFFDARPWPSPGTSWS
jgi:carboxylesterase type B